jgi:diguanylate cyclase (GGDEF)-like protein
MMLFFLGVGKSFWRPYSNNRLTMGCDILVFLLAGTRLLEFFSATSILQIITPFSTQLAQSAIEGKPIQIGINTAIFILMCAAASIFFTQKKYVLSQLLAFLALGIPFVSFTGYLFATPKFYGQMALMTVISSILVGYATLLVNAQHNALRAILSPWIGGKIARIQLVLGYVFPIFFSYLLFVINAHNSNELIGLFVISTGMFITLLVAYSAKYQEKIDASRRKLERKQNFAATTDALTLLGNRHFLLESGHYLIERAERNHEDLSVMMIDVDHFKYINDNYGHQAGDKVLQILAATILESIRKEDISGRYGGEEFVVLLPCTDLSGAMSLAEKLRQSVATQLFPIDRTVTVSVGCAELKKNEDLNVLLSRADRFMYQAKANGRNQVAGYSTTI